DWELSDTALGGLNTAFILLYAAVGLPLGHWADWGSRRFILSVGVAIWSIMTSLSGAAQNFNQLFACRLGVGVGEASCAPASNSLLGDLYTPRERARATALFMLGLPVGLGLGYILGGYMAQYLGWRTTFYIAGVPGILLAILALYIAEPER